MKNILLDDIGMYTFEELYCEASRLKIPGKDSMDKNQLKSAIASYSDLLTHILTRIFLQHFHDNVLDYEKYEQNVLDMTMDKNINDV